MLSLYIIARCEFAGEKEKNDKETLEVLESLKCKYKKEIHRKEMVFVSTLSGFLAWTF